MIDLDNMVLFVEVVKARSFRGAAAGLGMPNSTLSRRIGELEKKIGLRLLHRTTRKIELTEAGQIYYERCKRIVEEARLAHEQLGEIQAQPSGVLRASLPVDFAVNYLAPHIARFSEAYPRISFEFDLTPRNVNLVTEPFDVAIRMGPQADSSLIARPLTRLTPFLYASPGYLERFGAPATPDDLKQHECLDFPRSGRWRLTDGNGPTEIAIGGRFRLNSMSMIRRLATLDHGLCLVPEEMIADDLQDGRLQRVLPSWRGEDIPVFALTETRLLPAKTQLFIDFLRQQLRKP